MATRTFSLTIVVALCKENTCHKSLNGVRYGKKHAAHLGLPDIFAPTTGSQLVHRHPHSYVSFATHQCLVT